MAQRAHVQAGLLGQLCNARPIVVVQCLVGQDGVRDLRVGDQVDLQQLQAEIEVVEMVALLHAAQARPADMSWRRPLLLYAVHT